MAQLLEPTLGWAVNPRGGGYRDKGFRRKGCFPGGVTLSPLRKVF